MIKNENDSKIDILIVDDRSQNLLALESVLDLEDINIIKANSGEEALTLTLDYDFAVALLDVEMPGMSGFELAEYMRGAEKTKHIPIIFITATTREQGSIFKGYDSGAVDFIYKPVEPRILKNKIKIFVSLYKQNKMLKIQSEALESNLVELKKAVEISEAANRMKSRFLANASHELRTPLTAIIGISKMLTKYKNDKLTEDQLKSLEIINNESGRLVDIINDLLDIAKIEAGKMDISIREVSLNKLIESINQIAVNLISKKEIKFIAIKTGIDIKSFYSDPAKLTQILINLVGNAIKFTDKGTVTLEIECREDEIDFKIIDTGIGINEEDIEKLFTEFCHIENQSQNKEKGTGLGLALSQKMAGLLGGKITAASKYGAGSEFKVTMPRINSGGSYGK